MLIVIAFVSVALLTFILMRLINRLGVLDIPNERSSHTRPTPRGGGAAIVATFIIFLVVDLRFDYIPVDDLLRTALLVGGVLVAAIGLADDLNGISARWRFLTHVVAVFVSLSILQRLPDIQVFGFQFQSQYALFILLGLSLVWFINLFNFMDGIDGIAGVEAITTLGGAALLMFIYGQDNWLLLFGFLATSVAGFLVWNWPPAKVFMGDACSGFLGFTLGILAIASSADSIINVWSWLILFGVFVVDATTTLVTGIFRGERWFEAHRSHAYQILSRRLHSHRKVTIGVLVINVAWLFPLAVLAAGYPYWAAAICCAALLPLLIIAIQVGAGRRETES